ncbi:MAG TPA: carboxypeptidase regulatory-like domain-containing protein [Bryobacteraceae bacterium]|nr:carboxypeptidase regulatory-like domain-containing protein [Bryobacteraceae bacterium]
MASRNFPQWISALLLAVVAVVPVAAQDERATILGTVVDNSGTVVPGAVVTVRNTGTGERRATRTDERGNYEVQALNIGTYEVTVEQPGFRKGVVSGITLVVNQRARIDFKLQLGEVTQEVTVKEEAPLVQTDDATVGQLINEQQIRELPIPGNRNMFRLALLSAGMSRGPASSVTTSGFGPGFGIAAMGQKVHNNWIMLDGAPLRTAIHGAVRMRPSVEALEEFRVESGFYSAEFGTESGAQIISAIRPGTNQFHGTLFEFLRNDVLDARNFFENPATPKQPLRRNNFGAVVSGRIIRDKLFFTANYEGYIERISAQAFAVYPTDKMRSGDLTDPFFHAGRDPTGALTPIKDILSGLPFPGNQIPASRIAPQSQKLMQFFPQPNLAGVFTGSNDFTGKTITNTDDHQGFLRIDYNIGPNDRLFGRYGVENVEGFAAPVNSNTYFGQHQPKRQQNAVITYTRLMSPTKLNQFTISYNRDLFSTLDAISGSNFNIARDLGIPGLTNDPFTTGVPAISITGVTGFGNSAPNTIWDENRRVADTFSFTHGSHSMKAGVDFQHVLLRRQTFSFVTGAFDFTGSQSGSSWADFLLDWPNQVREAVTALPGIRPGEQFTRMFAWRLHSFFTDDWKVTPKLTLNFGLRWELNSPIRDIRGLTPNFDFSTGQIYPPPGVSANLYNWDRHDFAPRFGLAWRPFGGDKTVVRASYGVFYNVNMWNNLTVMTINPPFNISINQLNPPGKVSITMANADQATNVTGRTTPEVLGVPADYGLGNAQQWTLNIQRALPHDMVWEVGYVGSKSTHFDRPAEYNLINVLAGQTTRPLPQWGDIEFIDTDASGTYEALITKVEKRMSQGVTALFTYTFSKTLFDSFAGNGANRLSNPFDARAEKGLAETDQRHRATASFLWELPFFRAQRGVTGHLLGGWQANGVLTLETGMPFYPIQSTEPIADGCPRCNPRPDRLANGNLPGSQRTLQRWFDTSAFKTAVGHYGTSGRNILTAPGLRNLDFSMFKNFRVTEGKRFQFRWEMYNSTNTPPFNPPGATIGTGTFGQVTSAGSGRVMQSGLRFEF